MAIPAPVASSKKPPFEKYAAWLQKEHDASFDARAKNRYETTTVRVEAAFRESAFWKALLAALPEWSAEYRIDTGYALLASPDTPPTLMQKPWRSFVEKTFRKNVLYNENWPDPPEGGWLLPMNCISRINDNVRTTLVAKYLDGVSFLAEHLVALGAEHGLPDISVDYEAKDEGYYAAHAYMEPTFEVPGPAWDLEPMTIPVEIQITTQVQDVIRRLLHKYYEERRAEEPSATKWQWDYQSESFSVNYLGHILHYVEGMIMDIRLRQDEPSRDA